MHRHLDLPQAFADLGIEAPILRSLAALGYREPTPIQRELIPLVLAGKDVLGQARTGTGKTAAFGMPSLQMLDPQGHLQVLVLTPTRELAAQVIGELRRLAQFMEIRCVPVYGGTRIKEQLHLLGRRPHVVVGTPGRVQDMMRRGALRLDSVRFAILDEVDRMLDIGFRDDIRRILGAVTHRHQTIFVSATIDDEINRLGRRHMHDPVEVDVSRDELTVREVSQHYCTVDPWDKFRLLKLLIKQEAPSLAIVFCNTKHVTRKLAKRLHAAGINARDIHGDLIQQKRESIMERFRKHKIPVLVATDLAARGIDVHDITHIVNYDSPQDIEVYVHRIGRTARMGASGKAITFIGPDQGGELFEIEKLINKEIQQLHVDGFQPSPPPRGEPASETPEALVASTAKAGESSESATSKTPAPVRTLGGKFPVPRRYRRR
ncbi:MAG: DEAD/DEAH box helicase [Phycisphaerae bacterium]|nr:DEAD/DEAH box helicase [Phycisphaerae bacterium]